MKQGDIVPNQAVRGHLFGLTVADHPDRPGGYQGQLVHSHLGPDFLNDTDDRIAGGNDEEQHVFDGRTADHQHQGQNYENQVKKGENMGENNLRNGLSGGLWRAADPTGPDPLLNLTFGQANGGVGGDHIQLLALRAGLGFSGEQILYL